MAVEFKQSTLDNGLSIVAEVNGDAHTAAVGFFVRTGSRDEPVERMGVSHFLEHMMFKGTERRSAADVNREFDEIGANYNAMTSQEMTAFYAHVLPEYLPRAIDVLADILRPSLREDDFEMEKNVILEEIGMYADKPFFLAAEQVTEDFFGEHPLAFRVLGTRDTVSSLTADQMRRYFQRHYSPDNIVVSLGGRLDFERVVSQLSEACGAWERTGVQREHGKAEPRAAERTLRKESTAMHYLVGLCPGPSEQDERRYAAAVLAHVLGDGDGSRLYWKLVDTGLADAAEVAHEGFDGTGAFLFYADCPPDRAAEVEAAMNEVLDHAADDLSESEVERAVSKIAMDLTLQNERPAGRMMALGAQWLYLGRYMSLDEELRRVQSIGVADIKALLEEFPLKPRTLVRLTPGRAE